MLETPTQYIDLVRVLNEHEVDFVLVGALAAVLQGAPISTFDMDIVHSRDPANVRRLVAALKSVHAYYWEHTLKRLEPEERTLLLPGHHLLNTDLGRIDVLGRVGAEREYPQLIGQSIEIPIGAKQIVFALNLEAIIETKREADRPKDRLALPVLINTLAELKRAADDSCTTNSAEMDDQ